MKEQINKIPAEETRQRVDKLKETDNDYEDSIHKMADKEDKFREVLKNKDIGREAANEIANIYSEEVLEKIEAYKERWIDNLTGLRNKNALKEEVPQLLSMGKRQNNGASFLMVDFDYFKKVNDELGHPAGDQALKKIVEIIKSQVRSADMVYRFGGEEFAIFLSNTASAQAAELAERIRAAVEQTGIELVDDKGQKINLNKTVSIGCVGTDQLEEWSRYTEPEAKNFLELIIKDADQALYEAKQTGRNRVMVHGENQEEPEIK